MKAFVLGLTLSVLASSPAFADVDTICQGGARGNEIRVEITDAPGVLKIRVNSELVTATRDGESGSTLSYSFNGNGKAFGIEYDFNNATAELNGPMPSIKLFCSRY